MSIDGYKPKEREHIETLLAGAALDALSSEDAEALEGYLRKDPSLYQELQDYRACTVSFAASIPQVSPPHALKDRIIQSSDAKPAVGLASFRWPQFHRQQVAIAIGVTMLLVTGWNNVALRQQLAEAQNKLASLRGQETYAFALKGTLDQQSASGVVLLDVVSNRATLNFQNLRPLRSGEFYHLWAITDQKIVPCGQFQANSSRRVVEAIPIPANAYHEDEDEDEDEDFTLIVTVESEQNITKPSSNVVMQVSAEL